MNTTLRIGLAMAVVFFVLGESCGGSSIDGAIGPTGGDVCLSPQKVCIRVPSGALEAQEIIRISPGSELPGGELSEGFDISAVSGRKVTFLKPATVSFSMDLVRTEGLESETLLRLYTKEDGEWQPLERSSVDRVQRVVQGETRHLSPFVVLRSDRLPDGGVPLDLSGRDAGGKDAGRPVDAGRPDAGRPDAGAVDAGRADAGMPDAGTPDAGPHDAGIPDAGRIDAGQLDAGTPDAGRPDAGAPDAGHDAGFDAGVPDAGQPDAGPHDAGEDAGEPDAGALETDAGQSDAGDEDAG